MIKGMTLGLKGGKMPLVLGLVFGVIAAILAAVYLSSAGGGGGSVSSGVTTMPAVVSAKNIDAGTRITADMVTVRDVAKDDLLPGAFDKPDGVVGQVTTVNLVAGEQVIATKITATGAALKDFGANPPLALLVDPGMRAVSVEVNSIVGAGGLIRPGDFVDVVLTVKYDSPHGLSNGKNQASVTILQNVKVLALNQTVEVPSSSQDPTKQPGNQDKATTATLAVTPAQGEVLTLADSCRANFEGRLALAVRSFGDAGKFAPRAEWPADGHYPDCTSLFGGSLP